MRRAKRQHLAGLTVNEHVNVPRTEFDLFKALLHNCVREGPESQNRAGYPDFRTHLLGRLSYFAMIHPERAAKLRREFERIPWPRV